MNTVIEETYTIPSIFLSTAKSNTFFVPIYEVCIVRTGCCTINELLSLSQRYEVAKMLREGKTYLEIAEKTGASTATISRVNRSLNYGSDGYDMVFARLTGGTQADKGDNES